MNRGVFLLLLCSAVFGVNATQNETCKTKILSEPSGPPTGLSYDITFVLDKILAQITQVNRTNSNFSQISMDILNVSNTDPRRLVGLIISNVEKAAKSAKSATLTLNYQGKIVDGSGPGTEVFWNAFNTTENGWSAPFRDCYLSQNTSLRLYRYKNSNVSVGLFVLVDSNQCELDLHHCHKETTYCIPEYESDDEYGGGYGCLCRDRFYYPGANFTWRGFSGESIENGLIDSYRCVPCSSVCEVCENGVCAVYAQSDFFTQTVIVSIQLVCMGITVLLALIVFKQRKCKTIASGMWTILEIILLGIFLIYSTVVIRFLKPSVMQCLLEPWARELGFVICYGAIILKLYRHLIEFRTRKAHRWVVKDTDLLKYLLIMVVSLLAYMAAYTSISLNFMQENYSLLFTGMTPDGVYYKACKPLWWDYVTELGEMMILIFGIHLSYASRNARTQFQERRFLCAAICIELAASGIFYFARILVLPELHPDLVLLAYCLRTQFTATITLLLVFVPKFWYQQKQVRSLAQEYSCRLPVDAFKDININAHGPLTSNNSDVDMGEVTLADMSSDDIRAELKRLYLQLEIFKSKTICRDNPHISKRRGGRKAQHRRFSLQNLYGKHRVQKQAAEEATEAEPSRTPEDSVCSVEGPSTVYNDLPSTTTAAHTDHK